eukprot:183979-Chlamydomonas_euryale.AAC.1
MRAQIEDCKGQRDFFTSFLARESAYRLIVAMWAQTAGVGTASARQALFPASSALPGGLPSHVRTRS